MSEQKSGGGASGSELDALNARLARKDPEPGKAPRTPQERKARLMSALRWSGAGAMLLAAVLVFGQASALSASNQAELIEGAKPLKAAQARLDTAQAGLEALPKRDEAQRWLAKMNEDGVRIAKVQNTFLAETGPVSTAGIPDVDPEPEPGTKAEKYTPEQKQKLAEQRRANTIAGLDADLSPSFNSAAQDEHGFDASSAWQKSIPALASKSSGESLSGYEWTFPQSYFYDQDGLVSVFWELRTKDDAHTLVGWVHGTWDPTARTFGELTIAGTGEDTK